MYVHAYGVKVHIVLCMLVGVWVCSCSLSSSFQAQWSQDLTPWVCGVSGWVTHRGDCPNNTFHPMPHDPLFDYSNAVWTIILLTLVMLHILLL